MYTNKYGIILTKYDEHILEAMELVNNYIKNNFIEGEIQIVWILNAIDTMPHIEEVRELEAIYKFAIEIHELSIVEGAISGHSIGNIIEDIKKKYRYCGNLKFIVGNHYTDSNEAVFFDEKIFGVAETNE